MKIAQISATFPPYMAGTGIVCYHNSLELAKLGHDVTIFTEGDARIDKVGSNIRVVREKAVFSIGNAPLIPQLLKLKGFDIIHLHYPYFFGGEFTYLLNKINSIKYVITYHNDVFGSNLFRPFINLHNKFVMKRVLMNASIICVPTLDFASNSNLKSLINRDPNKFIELPNGVDTSLFHPSVESRLIRAKYCLKNKRVILFVRALDHAHFHGGLECLLESIAGMREKDIVLMVVGDGNLKQHFIELSRRLGVDERVIFAGWQDHNLLPYYYAACDVVVLPSILSENFPLVLLEALASGKPAICSALPGVRKIIDNGKNGFYAKPNDVEDLKYKILSILGDKSIRTEFGRNGRLKAEKEYSWDRIALKLEKIYQEVIS